MKIEDLNDFAYFLEEIRISLKDLVRAVLAQQRIINSLLLKEKKE